MRAMRALVVAVGFVAGVVPLAASDDVKAIVSSYLEVHAALASDRADAFKTPAGTLAARAESMGASGTKIAKAARKVEHAKNLQAARDAFVPLSDAVIAAAKAANLPEVKVAYCPMAKASWLQKGDEVRNPYYGSQMLTCGEIKK